jgi:predicted nucleic acid-binding protein
MIFVDTGAWYAQSIPEDPHFGDAREFLRQNKERFLTTDYVVDETLTLLRSRDYRLRALELGHEFFQGDIAVVHYLAPEEIREAWRVFDQFSDKEWSFMDCTSRVVMARLGITTAFAFDNHFRQFGTVNVVP